MDADQSNAQLLQAVQAMQANNYVAWAALALVLYDFVITFRHEMRIVWIPLTRWAMASPATRRLPINARAGLFLTIRWAMVVAALLIVIPVAPSRCESDVWVSNIVVYIVLTQVALFSAIRIFAIYFRNSSLALITLALGLVRVVVNIYVDGFRSSYSYVGWPVSGCVQSVTLTDTELTLCLYLSRATVIAMDVLVLVLIWARTYRQWRDARAHLGAPSIVACFLVDGTWYFFVLLALNIADTLTFSTTGSLLSALTQVLPSVLMNHFIIDLRAASDAPGAAEDSASASAPSALLFHRAPASSYGNSDGIGQELSFGGEAGTGDKSGVRLESPGSWSGGSGGVRRTADGGVPYAL